MSEKDGLALSIGVLGGLAVLLTAEVIEVPVWVVFIAWASFFVLGGGPNGFVRSLASNVVGIAIASLCLLIAQEAELGTWWTAVVVGAGSAAMVEASRVPMLSVIPAIVFGFASTVGTSAVTGREVLYTDSIGNPVLMVITAMALGATFGIASEVVARLLVRHRATGPATVPMSAQ